MKDQTRYAFWYSRKQAERRHYMIKYYGDRSPSLNDLRINGKKYTECRRLSAGRPFWNDAKYIGMGTISEVTVNGVEQ